MFWAAGARPDTRLWKERNFSTRVLSRSLLSISPADCPRIALLTSLTLIRAALLGEKKKRSRGVTIGRETLSWRARVLRWIATTIHQSTVYRPPSTTADTSVALHGRTTFATLRVANVAMAMARDSVAMAPASGVYARLVEEHWN